MRKSKRIISIILVAIFSITSVVFVGMSTSANGATKAEKAYQKFLKKKKGYYSIRNVKGSKYPVMFYTKKAKRTVSFIEAGSGKKHYGDGYYANNHSLYVFSKGKVKKVKVGDMLKVSTKYVTAVAISKGRITTNSTDSKQIYDVMYLKKNRLMGKRYDFTDFDWSEDYSSLYVSTISDGRVLDDKHEMSAHDANIVVNDMFGSGSPLVLKKAK